MKNEILTFTKMHSMGNDFIVVDNRSGQWQLQPKEIQRMAHRQYGIGFDQLLMFENTDQSGVDFQYRIMNANGEEVGQCGNGARCLYTYLIEKNITQKTRLNVVTSQRTLTLFQQGQDIGVELGVPDFSADQVPIHHTPEQGYYTMDCQGNSIQFSAVSMGNPHAVIDVEDLDETPVKALGEYVQQSDYFPESVNVGFMQVLNRGHIRLRVYERGVGETLACGSGAGAAVASGIVAGRLDAFVRVDAPGGVCQVAWPDKASPITLYGQGVIVFEGSINRRISEA